MPYSLRSRKSVTIDGNSTVITADVDAENIKGTSKTLAAAISGTLSTRTDANTGIVTVPSGHGVTASDTVVVTWLATGVRTYRYNVDVTAVTATTVSIDLGAGTDLPIATSAVTISIQQTEDVNMGTKTMANWLGCEFSGAGEHLLVLEVDNGGSPEYHPFVITPTTPITFVSGEKNPDRSTVTIGNVFTGITTTRILEQIHLANIATASNAVKAEIYHN